MMDHLKGYRYSHPGVTNMVPLNEPLRLGINNAGSYSIKLFIKCLAKRRRLHFISEATSAPRLWRGGPSISTASSACGRLAPRPATTLWSTSPEGSTSSSRPTAPTTTSRCRLGERPTIGGWHRQPDFFLPLARFD